MPQFVPDQVAFGDSPGYGAWDIAHAREHIQFVQASAKLTPPILIPDFDVLQFLTAGRARSSILQSHAQAHLLLRAAYGITGVDLSSFNLDDAGGFYDFLSYNAADHTLIRQALGIS